MNEPFLEVAVPYGRRFAAYQGTVASQLKRADLAPLLAA